MAKRRKTYLSKQQLKLSPAERLRRQAEGAVERERMKERLKAQKRRARTRAAKKKRGSGNRALRRKVGGLTGIRQDLR